MTDEQLRELYRGSLAAIAREHRGDCPDPTELAAIAEGTARESERMAILRHVAECPQCRRELDMMRAAAHAADLSTRRTARPIFRLSMLALAASVLLAVGLSTWSAWTRRAVRDALPGGEPVRNAATKAAPLNPSPDRVAGNPAQVATGKPTQTAAANPLLAKGDSFRIKVDSLALLRVGGRTTLQVSVERMRGRGATPLVTWRSDSLDVLHVDPKTGMATATAEGIAVVNAVAGESRAEITVVVLPAESATEATTRSGDAADPSIRSLFAPNVLADAANTMVAAIRAKNVALAARLFANGRTADASDLLDQLKYLAELTVSAPKLGEVHFDPTSRTAAMDYGITLRWTTTAGVAGTRDVMLRAEARRPDEAWVAVRQRLLGGWR